MIRRAVCAALFLLALAAPAFGQGPSRQFVIGAWIGPHQSEAQYRLYREAGFNTVLDYPWEGDDYRQTLRLAEKAGGLSVILNIDQKFMRGKFREWQLAEAIRETRDNRLVSGYLLYDEPGEKEADTLAAVLPQIRSLAPNRLTWIDFYPLTDKRLARSLLTRVRPSVIATNCYPYRANGDRLGELYEVLESYRSLALEFHVPLWLFIQSSSWIWPQDRTGDGRMPTAAEIRMQVYASLAYGATGLWYYTYSMPLYYKDITAAILDRNDRPGPVFQAVRRLNGEVAALGPLLMTLTSKDVMHVKPQHGGVRPFVPNDTIAGIDGDNLLVGFFTDAAGTGYVMLVNKLAGKETRKVGLRLGKKAKGLSLIDRTTGRAARFPTKRGAAVVSLEPGDGLLFRVD